MGEEEPAWSCRSHRGSEMHSNCWQQAWRTTKTAAVLGISEGTVNPYLAYLFEKLGVTSRSEAVMAATRRGWRLTECAEHRECLPLLTPECERGRDAI